MKKPLEFHKRCLKALITSEVNALKEVESAEHRLLRVRASRVLLEGQIERAEKEKRDGFDSEKFHTALGLSPRRVS